MPAKPKTKRLTLELPDDLYNRIAAIAADERRELKPHLLVVIERACKMHEGRKRANQSRRDLQVFFRRNYE